MIIKKVSYNIRKKAYRVGLLLVVIAHPLSRPIYTYLITQPTL